MIPPRLSGVAAVGVLTLVLSGCAAEPQLATGVDTLRIATTGAVTPSHQAFIDRMNELSEGAVSVQVTENWSGSGEDPDEIALTKAVAAGEVDMAWVTVRSLAGVGVEGIDALEAPLLVRTHDQQRAVALGTPAEIIMKRLRETDLAGLALLPGPQLYPVASGAPVLAPGDLAGKHVQVGPTSPAEAAGVEALGGTPAPGTGGVADVLSGSVEVAAVGIAEYLAAVDDGDGPYLTASLSLWPRMSIIVINRSVLDRLSSRQHGFLDASISRAQSVAMTAADLDDAIADACKAGVRFGVTGSDNLNAFAEAVQPAWDQLKSDPAERRLLEAIEDSVKRNAGTGAVTITRKCRW